MSNAGLEEGSEEMQEIDVAEIKKLKVHVLSNLEHSLPHGGAVAALGTRTSCKTDRAGFEHEREQARTCCEADRTLSERRFEYLL